MLASVLPQILSTSSHSACEGSRQNLTAQREAVWSRKWSPYRDYTGGSPCARNDSCSKIDYGSHEARDTVVNVRIEIIPTTGGGFKSVLGSFQHYRAINIAGWTTFATSLRRLRCPQSGHPKSEGPYPAMGWTNLASPNRERSRRPPFLIPRSRARTCHPLATCRCAKEIERQCPITTWFILLMILGVTGTYLNRCPGVSSGYI